MGGEQDGTLYCIIECQSWERKLGGHFSHLSNFLDVEIDPEVLSSFAEHIEPVSNICVIKLVSKLANRAVFLFLVNGSERDGKNMPFSLLGFVHLFYKLGERDPRC